MIELLHQKTNDIIKQLGLSSSHGLLLTGSTASNLPFVVDRLSRNWISATSEGQYLRNLIQLTPDEDGKITKESIDRLLARLNHKQSHGKRVVVIQNLELLHINSYNAMLKALEEPGVETIFVLTTTDPKHIPATVRSRMQHVQIPELSHKQIIDHFSGLGIDLNQLKFLSHITNGNLDEISSAISDKKLLDELMSVANEAKEVLTSDVYERLIVSRNFSKDRSKTKQFIQALIVLCSSALRSTASSAAKAQQWAKRIELLLEAERKLETNVQPRLIIQQLMVQL